MWRRLFQTGAVRVTLFLAALSGGLLRSADPPGSRSPVKEIATEFRPSDSRPTFDDQRARSLGIERYDSKRLRLYTDIEPATAKSLLPLVDQVYDAWTAYFGPLPPDREQAEFQITGYVMREPELFQRAGMLRDDIPPFQHGRNRGAEFWMNDQPLAYYREHLLLHEATHCFMTIVPGPRPPLWYLEGMAEFFGTHRTGEGPLHVFGVVPRRPEEFEGFGRIRIIRRRVRDGQALRFDDVRALGPQAFAPQTSEPYSWSWAACVFLDEHPAYRRPFRELARTVNSAPFDPEFDRRFQALRPQLDIEWDQFAQHFVEGYDFERSRIEFLPGQPLSTGAMLERRLRADRGWQSMQVQLVPGSDYDIAAAGQVILKETTQPWRSGPDGISIEYSEGRPIGRVLAAILNDDSAADSAGRRLGDVVEIGAQGTFQPTARGTLYMRTNDAWNSLDDNQGEFVITVRRSPAADRP